MIAKVSAVVVLLGAIIGIVTQWSAVGWTTPNQHAADFVVAENVMKEFRDEWKCDEYDEELLDLKEKRERLIHDDQPTTEIDHQIEKIREKMRKIDCSRFEDFG